MQLAVGEALIRTETAREDLELTFLAETTQLNNLAEVVALLPQDATKAPAEAEDVAVVDAA